jgi:hypothetical protein
MRVIEATNGSNSQAHRREQVTIAREVTRVNCAPRDAIRASAPGLGAGLEDHANERGVLLALPSLFFPSRCEHLVVLCFLDAFCGESLGSRGLVLCGNFGHAVPVNARRLAGIPRDTRAAVMIVGAHVGNILTEEFRTCLCPVLPRYLFTRPTVNGGDLSRTYFDVRVGDIPCAFAVRDDPAFSR